MISARDLVSLLVLGVVLPSSLIRPAVLRAPWTQDHIRKRCNYAYTIFAFAALGFVDVVAIRLLRPSGALTTSARGALTGAAVIVVAIALTVHIPPILESRTGHVSRWVLAALAPLLGIVSGGFFAVDLVYPTPGIPVIAAVSWTLVLALAWGAMVWFSGLSPEARLGLYRRRRAMRHRRRRRSSRS